MMNHNHSNSNQPDINKHHHLQKKSHQNNREIDHFLEDHHPEIQKKSIFQKENMIQMKYKVMMNLWISVSKLNLNIQIIYIIFI